MANDHLSRHRDSGRVVTEMKKRIKNNRNYATRSLAKDSYKGTEMKKISHQKNYGMMATKVMIRSVGEQGMGT